MNGDDNSKDNPHTESTCKEASESTSKDTSEDTSKETSQIMEQSDSESEGEEFCDSTDQIQLTVSWSYWKCCKDILCELKCQKLKKL